MKKAFLSFCFVSITNTISIRFDPRPFADPAQKGPLPVAIFHGLHQDCKTESITNLVNKVAEGTKGHVECIEIGSGVDSTLWTTMLSQRDEACKKIKEHSVFNS